MSKKSKKPVKRQRRSSAQVDATVRKIKEAIASGDSVADACKHYKMSPQMFYKYQDRAFPEIKRGRVMIEEKRKTDLPASSLSVLAGKIAYHEAELQKLNSAREIISELLEGV